MSFSTNQARIRCTQLAPRIGDGPGNLAQIETELASAASDGIDLLVLPELATSGYSLTPSEARDAALPADSPVFARWQAILGEHTSAVIGFCEHGGEDPSGVLIYNSAVILTPGSAPTIYRKLHLWDTEKSIFTPGSDVPPVVDTPFGKLGTVICYDLEFPEMPRSLALRGADVIAVPTNWPYISRPENEHAPEVVHAMAAARASGVAIACCDRSGEERGTVWTEGTTVVGTDGWVTGEMAASGRYDAAVELAGDRRRISPRNDVFGDRRPEFYEL
ncbi:hydrolase [Leucobacter insecticola]|uniref:Hydrolase n=1 Tax=Leucobacter insecticola TaxID=2714934 RepID=A0A6G8FGC8_9MICO|nr:nitrilase-related carbon-nitrogen hydrolase [Leucobacter insecticola]QIM15309.1 hydrolase [Leucobacter insecticola]